MKKLVENFSKEHPSALGMLLLGCWLFVSGVIGGAGIMLLDPASELEFHLLNWVWVSEPAVGVFFLAIGAFMAMWPAYLYVAGLPADQHEIDQAQIRCRWRASTDPDVHHMCGYFQICEGCKDHIATRHLKVADQCGEDGA